MLFDTHIHFDQLSTELQQNTLADPNITGVLAVAINLKSSQTLLALQQQCPHKILYQLQVNKMNCLTGLQNTSKI